mmetsp:Transcript_53650/g.131467  ORF Transcript_53650/g.131467 Transcript_53650/m.131467 type:complete len:181 (-) Transcript_53650:1716-2258(-)|eukprot:CAMPEP_0198370766 /NCGR_PEP_ID=MMETSP1450-20131203/156881_1 /TAXON_ID=753684 ORGANISM="Madagascaria erythrocladiodes, Strain CCMP3234" /NCGR_SAMPLE_ID=MMETSP1450 /ASSEMBLY_ACC=CAM_ASM_001115 /LENGTH=180 /DNA_ID=CAMNT_0044078311 /DNA_START=240 /DNA_END=782 /DNA_ORIENTATION=+
MKALIIYGTEEGQTRKICRYLRDEAVAMGHVVDLVNANDEPPEPNDFDKVVLATPVHMGKFHKDIRAYVHQHDIKLNPLSSAFLTVSLAAANKEDKKGWDELVDSTNKFLGETAWKPNRLEHVAGALTYSKYGWISTFIMQHYAKKHGEDTDRHHDYEETDWGQLKTFASEFFGNGKIVA